MTHDQYYLLNGNSHGRMVILFGPCPLNEQATLTHSHTHALPQVQMGISLVSPNLPRKVAVASAKLNGFLCHAIWHGWEHLPILTSLIQRCLAIVPQKHLKIKNKHREDKKKGSRVLPTLPGHVGQSAACDQFYQFYPGEEVCTLLNGLTGRGWQI